MGARTSTTLKNALVTQYKTSAPFGALFSADPGTANAATNELTGGSPAYARVNLTWGTVSAGSMTSAATTFNVASGSTVAYFGTCTAGTAATADVQDTIAVTSQAFNSQGTYQVTATYSQA